MTADRRATTPSSGLRRAARWTLERLPADRRPAARALVRSARSLTLGGPLPSASSPAPAPAPRPRSRPRATSSPVTGAWVRRRPAVDAEPEPIPTLDDPGESAAVRTGWQLVSAYEALTTAGAAEVFGPDLAAWHRYARETIPDEVRAAHAGTSPTNWLRFRRMADLVRDGDTVFDVGTGKGELAGVLMSMRDIEYRGVELETSVLERFRAWNAEHHPDRTLDVTNHNLYDLTPEQVAEGGTSVVMCCEVLEHVPDAEKALATLARTLPDGADLVFSVPLHGRLEAVWGHISVFDTARLHRMVREAGLHVHHVEPLANVWTLVVANRTPAPSDRVATAGRRPDVLPEGSLTRHHPFGPVRRDVLRLVGPDDATLTEHASESNGSRLRFTGSATVEIPTEGLEAFRFRIAALDVGTRHAFRDATVEVRTDTKRIGTWTWRPKPGLMRVDEHFRVAFRPGEATLRTSSAGFTSTDEATRALVTFSAEPGVPVDLFVEFALLR